MITIADMFPPDEADVYGRPIWSEDIKAKMQARIASAYHAFAEGRASRDDADLVLIDLAQFTRYLDTATLDMPTEVVTAIAHRRAVFGRIVEAVIAAGGNIDGLHRAVLMTPSLDVEET